MDENGHEKVENISVLTYVHQMTKETKQIFVFQDKEIGKGKFGIVFKGMMAGYGPVAVKYISIRNSPMFMNDLKVEIKIAKVLSPDVAFVVRKVLLSVAVPELNDEKELVAISPDVPDDVVIAVYDLADGMTLGDVIKITATTHSEISQPVMDRYAQELLMCLHALDIAGIAHRDIKPENLMLDKGRIKLIDFGFSCFILTCQGQKGTAYYLPPEFFIQPKLKQWEKADIFAVGVTIFKLLSNLIFYAHLPFDTKEEAKKFFQTTSIKKLNELFQSIIVTAEKSFPLMKRYRQLLFGMLDANPESRWTAEHCSQWFENEKILLKDDLQIEMAKYAKQRQIRREKEMEEKLQEELLLAAQDNSLMYG
jgi:serine/threonine protein kinase